MTSPTGEVIKDAWKSSWKYSTSHLSKFVFHVHVEFIILHGDVDSIAQNFVH